MYSSNESMTMNESRQLNFLQTLLCATVVHHLEVSFKTENLDTPVLAIYLNYKEQESQTLYNLVGSLLQQLVQREGPSFRSSQAEGLYQGAGEGSRPTPHEYDEALFAEIEAHDR